MSKNIFLQIYLQNFTNVKKSVTIILVMEMIIREMYLNRLIEAKDTEFIKVITGVRRSGKSTLLLMFKDFLLNNKIKKSNIIYINLKSAIYEDIKNMLKITKKFLILKEFSDKFIM